MIRVFRDKDGEWWVDRSGRGHDRVSNLDEFEDDIANRLAILLHIAPGDHVEGVGRRVSKDTFWLFKEGEDSWLLTADTILRT